MRWEGMCAGVRLKAKQNRDSHSIVAARRETPPQVSGVKSLALMSLTSYAATDHRVAVI
jgi:hypothetical protein